MITKFVLLFLIASGVSFLFLLFFMKRFAKSKVLSVRGIPLVGGIAIALSFLGVAVIWLIGGGFWSKELFGLLGASMVMLVFGIVDDVRELSVASKFAVQIIAALLLIFFNVRTQIALIGTIPNALITLVWVVGITNAFNHLDVMDGLAGGVAMIAAFSFFVLGLFQYDLSIAIISIILAGTLLSFLIYNVPPARMYMGNSGSHFLGFVLAAIALVLQYAQMENRVALLSPLLILGFPIFDTIFVMLVRMRRKKSVFKKSIDHFALRLLKAGFSKRKALLCMGGVSLIYSCCGVVLHVLKNQTGIIVILSLVLCSFLLTKAVGKASLDG
ncbi:MAG: MraY family glycosyltransferase [Candidatus Omnitrophota bacterium]|jgi:UDP-GlcNAc:undecaprenyl-phosphate GlcNAc-1-phosphate transferase